MKNVEFVRKKMSKAANHISSETLPLWKYFNWLHPDRKDWFLNYLQSPMKSISANYCHIDNCIIIIHCFNLTEKPKLRHFWQISRKNSRDRLNLTGFKLFSFHLGSTYKGNPKSRWMKHRRIQCSRSSGRQKRKKKNTFLTYVRSFVNFYFRLFDTEVFELIHDFT